MRDLTTALYLAIGRGALAKHQETCEVCSDTHDCVIAKAHKRTLADLSDPPMESYKGCDCVELCSMGPTCPGGGLAGLPGSGCDRVTPPGDAAITERPGWGA